MKMAAWAMFRSTAGMKNGGALFRWETGQRQVFECRRWDGGYIFPILRLENTELSIGLGETTVGFVEIALKFKQFQCEFAKDFISPYGLGAWVSDEVPEATCEFRKIGDGLHAVLFCQAGFPRQPGIDM